MKAHLWLTSEYAQEQFSRRDLTLEERMKLVHVDLHGNDLTDSLGWVKVGCATLSNIETLDGDALRQSLVAGIDVQIRVERLALERRIQVLMNRKQQLLCLEAPQ